MFTRADPASGSPDLWVQAVGGETPPSRFTTDPDVDHLATFSPDGAAVAWEAHDEGDLILVRQAIEGRSGPERIRRWGRAGGTTDWSPDGRFILYYSIDEDGSINLWMVPVSGEQEPFPLVESPFNHQSGKFSPDGGWLAYTSDETGQAEVYLQRLDGARVVGAPIRVSDGGGHQPQWRRDGREMFFLAGDELMAVDTRLDRESPAGTPRVLFGLRGLGPLNSYAVTPDGARVLALVPVSASGEHSASVVLDWDPRIEDGR